MPTSRYARAAAAESPERMLEEVARFTARGISGAPITAGSAQASGLAQFTTSAAVTNERYDPHISRICQPSQPDGRRRRTAPPASAAGDQPESPQPARGESHQAQRADGHHRDDALVGDTEPGMPTRPLRDSHRQRAEHQADGAGGDVNAEENGV